MPIYAFRLRVSQMLTKLMELVLKQPEALRWKKFACFHSVSVFSQHNWHPHSYLLHSSKWNVFNHKDLHIWLHEIPYNSVQLRSHCAPNTMSHPPMLSTYMFCMQLISMHGDFFHQVYCNQPPQHWKVCLLMQQRICLAIIVSDVVMSVSHAQVNEDGRWLLFDTAMYLHGWWWWISW